MTIKQKVYKDTWLKNWLSSSNINWVPHFNGATPRHAVSLQITDIPFFLPHKIQIFMLLTQKKITRLNKQLLKRSSGAKDFKPVFTNERFTPTEKSNIQSQTNWFPATVSRAVNLLVNSSNFRTQHLKVWATERGRWCWENNKKQDLIQGFCHLKYCISFNHFVKRFERTKSHLETMSVLREKLYEKKNKIRECS